MIELNFDNGYKYALTVIDLRSGCAWVVPLKNKTGNALMLAFQQIFNKSKRKPKKVWTDEGTEFYNKTILDFFKITTLHYTAPLMKEKRLLLSVFIAL